MKYATLMIIFSIGFWCGKWDERYGQDTGYKLGVWTRNFFTDESIGEQ